MSTTAGKLIAIAENEVGITENPSGSNKVKYNTWFYGKEVSGDNYPWCAAFVNWCFFQAGARELYYGGGACAGCTTLMNYHKKYGNFVTSDYRPGDLILMSWSNDGGADHIGIAYLADDEYVYTIEGNTSLTSNDNGGAVMRRKREYGCIVGAVRPEYESNLEAAQENNIIAEDDEMLSYDDFKTYMERYEAEIREKSEPEWSAKEGAWQKATDKGVVNGQWPETPIKRDEIIAVLSRLGLLG